MFVGVLFLFFRLFVSWSVLFKTLFLRLNYVDQSLCFQYVCSDFFITYLWLFMLFSSVLCVFIRLMPFSVLVTIAFGLFLRQSYRDIDNLSFILTF